MPCEGLLLAAGQEALSPLANAGVLLAGTGTDDPGFSADSITTCVTRLLEVKQQQELLASPLQGQTSH